MRSNVLYLAFGTYGDPAQAAEAVRSSARLTNCNFSLEMAPPLFDSSFTHFYVTVQDYPFQFLQEILRYGYGIEAIRFVRSDYVKTHKYKKI